MNNKWTVWYSIESKCNYTVPAVYKVRLTDTNGNGYTLGRLLKADDERIMCIGRTDNMKRRWSKFLSAIDAANGHSEMNLVYYLNEYTDFIKKFEGGQFQYCFRKCSDVTKSKSQEEQLIKAYFKKFGEVPPLNSAIPNRYVNWEF